MPYLREQQDIDIASEVAGGEQAFSFRVRDANEVAVPRLVGGNGVHVAGSGGVAPDFVEGEVRDEDATSPGGVEEKSWPKLKI